MRRSKHRISAFSLSFLDIMACGFGAVTLLFLILKHDATSLETADPLLNAEVNLLQEDLRVGEEALVALRNSLARVDESLVEVQGLSARRIRNSKSKSCASRSKRWNGKPPIFGNRGMPTMCGNSSVMVNGSI